MKADTEGWDGTIRRHLSRSAEIKQLTADACAVDIAAAALLLADCLRDGGKILLCGNGGSAADCQHLATEFVSCLTQDYRRPGLPVLALTTDTSMLTAFANDFGFDGVFARQVQALGKPGDMLIGISTSGGSRNVVAAAATARRAGMRFVALTGARGPLVGLADIAIRVPSDETQHIQEAHLVIEHILCHLVERYLYGEDSTEAGRAGRVREETGAV